MKPYARNTKTRIGLTGCLVIIAIMVVMFLLLPFILMTAWNLVMPHVFGLPTIDYVQAFAMYIVFSILLGIIRGDCNQQGIRHVNTDTTVSDA